MALSVTLDQYLWQSKSAINTVGLLPVFLNTKYDELTVYVAFSHTSDSGVITLETAIDPNYSGTWASIGTITWSAIDKTSYISVTGVFKALRARISTGITTGSCDCYVVAATPLGS